MATESVYVEATAAAKAMKRIERREAMSRVIAGMARVEGTESEEGMAMRGMVVGIKLLDRRAFVAGDT